MASLRPDPPLFDLDAWRAQLEELRAEPASKMRDSQIWLTEQHIARLEGEARKTPAEAP